MSRYDWPAGPRPGGRGDDPAARSRHNARRHGGLDADGALRASRTPAPPRRLPGGTPAPLAPVSGRARLWQPLGPVTLLGGQAEGLPRVSGRVNALAVHDGGQRVYAATANGGVWYSKDGGASWVSVAGLASTNTAGILRPAQRNACGAIHVDFGAAEGDDLVFLGTGEVTHPMTGDPGSSEGGIGIFVGDKPTKSAAPDPWVREAPNLVNDGVYRIVREPGGNTVIAATRTGLYQRPASPGLDKNWERPTSTPFDTLATDCTDLLWTAGDGARPARLWVWVKEGANAGLWVRDAGQANFAKVAIAAGSGASYSPMRASLAASTPPTQVWVLNDRGKGNLPLLFRVGSAGAAAPVATPVGGVPNVLRDSGFYNIAIAVDPANPNRVAVAGSYLEDFTQDGAQTQYNASIVVADVAPDPGNGGRLAYGHPTPYTMIGLGVHPDVHALAYSNGGATLWTGCDGGVFRSDRPTRPAGFYPRNNGLSISESNYVAGHPRCEGHLVAGLQDNGVVTRLSSGVWKMLFMGDGGGVVMDPVNPTRLLAQYVQGSWNRSPAGGTGPLGADGSAVPGENNQAAFYSMPACIAHVRSAPPAADVKFSQTLVGTNRLWYSENFGASWVTLPGKHALSANLALDKIGQSVRVCRWQNPDVAWVLCAQRIRRYTRTPGTHNDGSPGTWTAADVMPPGFVPTGKAKKRDPAPASLLDSAVWTDIAVNVLPASGGQPETGALYIGTVGHPTKTDVDTLWWYDGSANWFKTGLRAKVPAPVTALAVDPAFPNEVWVGTTVGVWQGTRTAGQPPTWVWVQRVNGLPEAAVEDLAIFSDDGIRLLRAAIASRGVWELRLDVSDLQDLTYVRAHDDDLRYRPGALGKQRDLATDRSWHGSPDVRPRVAPAAVAAPSTLPWQRNTFPGPTESLRRFQAALRSSTNDPRIVANGIWDAYFSEVLRDHGAPTVAVPAAPPIPALSLVQIDDAFWNAHMTGAHATAEPWATATASEADLYELTPALTEGERAQTSCSLPAGPAKVDIVVHRRGRDDLDGTQVRVTLLKWVDPATTNRANWSDVSTWFSGNVPWTAAVNEVLNSAAGTTAQAFADGWSFVGADDATRRRTLDGQTLDAARSGVATFDLDLSGIASDTVVLLVAVIRAGTGAANDIALAAATLENLAMGNASVAVRSLRITP